MLRIFASIAPSTARSRSASSKTRNGALPPSSIETRSSCCAACATSCRPTSVEPVNDSLRARGSAINAPVSAPLREVVTTFTTPAGNPASISNAAIASIESGVCLAGLTTHVQPAANAGPTLRVPIANGKFQGVTNTHGPTGSRIVSTRLTPVSPI